MRCFLTTLSLCAAVATPVIAEGPVVVELFTSQGCSSCPPADAILHQLAGREDVIPLALHVDYWDYIGWADKFARAEHTTRQQNYAREAGARTIYTPQMIIAGQDHVIGASGMEIAEAINTHLADPTGVEVTLQRAEDVLSISGSAQSDLRKDAMVQVIRYMPEATVDVTRGENAGRALTYANIVQDWQVVEAWDEGAARYDLEIPISGTAPVVVIVQEQGPGRVLAAAVLR